MHLTALGEIYRCETCGNIVEVLHTGKGQLVCCGKPMVLLPELTADEGYEKHVPAVRRDGRAVHVRVGETAHPMVDKHYIEWICVSAPDGVRCRKFLKPGDPPEASFCCVEGTPASVRAYCNLHGLWVWKE